jgi:hypothetical protein
VVEDGADGEGGNVCGYRGTGEHEVEVDLDARVLRHAGILAADVPVGALFLEDGLYGCIAEDDAGCEEAVEDCYADLY